VKQLNVLYILTKLELGGAQKVCLALHQGLVHDHHNAMLVSGSEGALKAEAEKTPGCILLDSFKREVSFFGLVHDFKTFAKLTRLIRSYRKKNPDLIVHTHSTKAGIIGRWAAFFAGVRHRIHTVHGFGFHEYQRWPQWLIIVALEWITTLISTQIICVSRKDQERGSTLLPGFAKKSTIIRAAVSDDHFTAPARLIKDNQKHIVIGTVSCFKPQKNLFDLLEAFHTTHKQAAQMGISTTLEIIGSGIQLTAIEAWITRHNLEKIIILHGLQEDVKPFLRQWDIFALSSLWEGLPCSIVEARLAGLPVVAYDVGGINEIVTHETNGFLVPPGNKELLAQRLQQLVHDQTLRKNLQQHQDILTPFSARSMINQHKALYKKLNLRARST
jgi:glycosyltransferase involved in cell wall biosynthesis